MFKKRMTRRQLLEALTARAQRAGEQYDKCLASEGLTRESVLTNVSLSVGTQLAFAEWYALRLALTTALTGDVETNLTDFYADLLTEGKRTVAELLERYR